MEAKKPGAAKRRSVTEAAKGAAETASASRAAAKKTQVAAAELAEEGAESIRHAAEQHGLQLREAAERVQDGAATLARTGETVAAGLHDVGRLWAEFMQDGMRESVAATQSLMRARSFGEAMRIQSEFLRSSFELFMETTAEISDLSKQMLTTSAHRMATVTLDGPPSIH
jgi:hypothetical protein